MFEAVVVHMQFVIVVKYVAYFDIISYLVLC